MEAILDTYAQPYDSLRPVVYFDEKSYQLLDHVREPLPPVPGYPARVDHEYKRCGTVNLFVAFEPLTGQRTVTVTERRGNAEFTMQLQALERRYPSAEKIHLVLDQLSTHTPAALYQYLAADEARQLTRRFEWVYTPEHASWLNMRAGVLMGVRSAQEGRTGMVSTPAAVSGTAPGNQRSRRAGDSSLGNRPQHAVCSGELAVQHASRTGNTETPLPRC
jgi:hypothetical protein